ncbi:MAG TPA: DUF4197 domain-containing protein [Novosphingobium sp.]|nr:DUF4197 domain-containing protein [Novosphingobium sp.]
MTMIIERRGFLAGAGATSLLALSACAGGLGGRFSFVDAVRRLLTLSSGAALDRLIAPGGFYDNQVARLDLPQVFGSRGGVLANILTGVVFRDRLQRQLNEFARDGARRAAPVVADTIRTIGFANAVDLIRGGPTAATGFLRQEMAGRLIDVMFPAIGDAMRIANDPVVGQALSALSGVDIGAVARDLSVQADTAIWGEIGREESAIRADPRRTNDPLLIAALTGANAF